MRYPRLFAYFVSFSVSRALEFRADFFFRIFMDCFYYIINISFFKLVFLNTTILAGWNEPQVMVFISGALMIDAIAMTLYSNNLWILPQLVNRGDLDYYLVRPVSTLFFVSLRDFAFNSFMNLLISIGVMVWALLRYPGHLSAERLLVYFVALMLGSFLYYLVRIVLIIPVFWTHSVKGFEQVFFQITRLVERPDRIFTGLTRFVFLFVIPVLAMASFPARLLLEPFDGWVAFQLLAITLGFYGATLMLWKWGLRSYSSASS